MMKKDDREIFRALGLLTQLGLAMGCCVLVGVLIGRFLDARLGSSPWLLIVFAFIGGAASFKVMYDIVIKEWMK